MFRYCETKNVVRKSWYPLLMHKMFRYQTFSETRKSSPRTFFRTVRQKTSTENRDITFLSTNFWMPEILFKHRGVPLRSFSVLWDENFQQKIRISGFMQKIFRYHKFSKAQTVSTTKFFKTSRQKTSKENRDIPVLCRKFFGSRNFLKYRRVLSRNVSVVWDKKPRQKIVICPSYAKKSSIPEIFWNTEGFFYEMFRFCEAKNVDKKSWYPLLMHKVFRYQIFSETQRSSPTKFFGTVRRKTLTKNRDIPFLCIKCFDTTIFLKHRKVPPRKFSALWDNRDTLFCIKLRNQNSVVKLMFAENLWKLDSKQ